MCNNKSMTMWIVKVDRQTDKLDDSGCLQVTVNKDV